MALWRRVIGAYTGSPSCNVNKTVAESCFKLAGANLAGDGVAKNTAEAFWWYRRAAKSGQARAATQLNLEGSICHAPSSCTAKPTGEPFVRCTRCKCAYYYSAECQNAHYKGHRKTCKRLADMTKAAEKPKPLTDEKRVRIARGLSPDTDLEPDTSAACHTTSAERHPQGPLEQNLPRSLST